MSVYLILTVIGDDRPGLVEQLSSAISLHGGNWLESRFAHLGGKFAGILRIQVAAAQAQQLEAELQQLSDFRITAELVAAEPSPRYARRLVLNLTAHDRIGIVRDVSQILHRFNINVEKLTTKVSSAPMSGDPLFEASASLQASDSTDLGAIKLALEQLSDDLMVDIVLDETR